MKIIAAIDSFKGCMESKALNDCVLNAIQAHYPHEDLINIPIADGGEGTIDAIFNRLGGHYRKVEALDPLGKLREAQYLMTTLHGLKTAIIESAEIIGIHLITPSEASIMQSSSYGLGQMMNDAINQDVKQICVTLGGSATSDGGLGMLAALGGEFGCECFGQNPLLHFKTATIDASIARLQDIKLNVLSDVKNPYSGEFGAAKIFGNQKGGNDEIIASLDQQAQKIVKLWHEAYQIDINQIAGSGAAGGLGGALAMMNGKIVEGFPYISQLLDLETIITSADLIFTGEGKMDAQTEQGKVPFGIAQLAKKHNVPVIALCGARESNLGVLSPLLLAAFSLQSKPISLENAMKQEVVTQNINMLIPDILKLFKHRGKND